jgi:uncharacterized LabA/DUF88 family protein
MKTLDNAFSNIRLAVLIDAENISANWIEILLKEIAKYGTANVKRIYGDWTNNSLNSWKNKLNQLAIQPMQQFRYTTGKNATDSALIIDAMDLLYTGNFDGFCLISSDSDFTRLASRIRESGLIVYGFGEQTKTPEAFVVTCNKFIYIDTLLNKKNNNNKKTKTDKDLLKLLKSAYKSVADQEGWADIAPFGGQIRKLLPSFNARNYGHKKLSELVQSVDIFLIKKSQSHWKIKLK